MRSNYKINWVTFFKTVQVEGISGSLPPKGNKRGLEAGHFHESLYLFDWHLSTQSCLVPVVVDLERCDLLAPMHKFSVITVRYLTHLSRTSQPSQSDFSVITVRYLTHLSQLSLSNSQIIPLNSPVFPSYRSQIPLSSLSDFSLITLRRSVVYLIFLSYHSQNLVFLSHLPRIPQSSFPYILLSYLSQIPHLRAGSNFYTS